MLLLRSPAPWGDVKKEDIRIGIQKRDGHLFDRSTQFLRDLGVGVDNDAGVKGKELSSVALRWGDCATLLTCRLEDIIENVASGVLDFGIVSDDVFRRWQATEKEATLPRKISILQDLGPAGSKLMLGVDIDFIYEAEKNPWADVCGEAPNRSWKKALKVTYRKELPIVTSDKSVLSDFLMRNKVRFKSKNILERRGTVEAQGRMMGALIVCDLVDSGETMVSCGYMPVKSAVISDSRMLLIGKEPSQPEKRIAEFVRFRSSVSTYTAPV
jgi:ATP phosphoribosyltransferase